MQLPGHAEEANFIRLKGFASGMMSLTILIVNKNECIFEGVHE
jgi:hypothetical protein